MTDRTITPKIRDAADRLARAARTGTPCPPVRSVLAGDDIDAAYSVQHLNVQRRLAQGGRAVGHKIGLTSPAVQRQLGVHQPDSGALFSDMSVPDGGVVAAGALIQPKIEAEVALVMGSDLTVAEPTAAEVVQAVDFALPALEIVDSRIEGWDISIVDTVADNASCGLFVLGGTPVPLSAVDLRSVRMSMTRREETVSEGVGSDCLDGPLNAAVWLATTLAAAGTPLRRGDVVLTGALGPMVPASPGDTFEADISGLGSVRVGFAHDASANSGEEDQK